MSLDRLVGGPGTGGAVISSSAPAAAEPNDGICAKVANVARAGIEVVKRHPVATVIVVAGATSGTALGAAGVAIFYPPLEIAGISGLHIIAHEKSAKYRNFLNGLSAECGAILTRIFHPPAAPAVAPGQAATAAGSPADSDDESGVPDDVPYEEMNSVV